VEEQEPPIELMRVDPAIEATQHEQLAGCAPGATTSESPRCASGWRTPRQGDENLMPLFVACVEQDVTLGEICQTLRAVWGEYRPATEL
jgi:methylmalonyl-CoA mutase, N-terminal domain